VLDSSRDWIHRVNARRGDPAFYAMEADDVAEVPNGLMAAGYVVSIPYCEQIELAEMPVTAFEMNVAYATT
jgi:hypothetical protein